MRLILGQRTLEFAFSYFFDPVEADSRCADSTEMHLHRDKLLQILEIEQDEIYRTHGVIQSTVPPRFSLAKMRQ